MEKLMYLVWADQGETDAHVAQRVLSTLEGGIDGVSSLRAQVADADVADGHGLRQEQIELPSAVVSFWVTSAQFRAQAEQRIIALSDRVAGYLVSESEPLVTPDALKREARTSGFCQIALLRQPQRLTRDEWLHWWLDNHTTVAIDTQSTFSYRQNVVVRPLTASAPEIDAIVEESFPIAALTDPATFFDAVGDESRLADHTQRMMESCARFIDFEEIGVWPTSEYSI